MLTSTMGSKHFIIFALRNLSYFVSVVRLLFSHNPLHVVVVYYNSFVY